MIRDVERIRTHFQSGFPQLEALLQRDVRFLVRRSAELVTARGTEKRRVRQVALRRGEALVLDVVQPVARIHGIASASCFSQTIRHVQWSRVAKP